MVVKKNIIILLLIQIILIFFMNTTIIYAEKNLELSIEILKQMSILSFVLSLVTGIILYKTLVNTYTIFLSTIFLFDYSRVFLDIIKFSDFGKADWFAYYNFSLETILFILNILNQNLNYLNLGIIIGFIFIKERKNKSIRNQNLEKITISIAVIIIPLVFFKLYKELMFIKEIGYLGVYLGRLRELNFSYITRISTTLFTYNYYIFLLTKPKYKNFKILSTIFLIISLMEALKGGRMALIVRILLIIWYLVTIYKKKIRMINIALLGTTIFSLSFLIESLRNKKEIEINSITSKLGEFLYGQGVSVILIGFYKDFKEKIPNKQYLFSPIIDIISQIKNYKIYSLGQSDKLIEVSSDFGQNMSYFLNKEIYLEGMGLGSNYMAELLTFLGINFFFMGCIFLGIQIVYFQKNFLKSRIYFLFFICFLENLFISGRATFFFSFINFVKLLGFYLMIIILGTLLKNLKAKMNKNKKF